MTTETVADPVGHISISGVHGGDELNERLAHAPRYSATSTKRGTSVASLVVGAAIGAALMYLYDPARGKRRRSLLRDQLVHALNAGSDRLGKVKRDARNRAVGAVAEVRGRVSADDADDDVITERVRAAIGRVVAHPSSVTVATCDGEVTLAGPILASEAEHLISTARGVRGVQRVIDQLEVHSRPGNVPGLQDATA